MNKDKTVPPSNEEALRQALAELVSAREEQCLAWTEATISSRTKAAAARIDVAWDAVRAALSQAQEGVAQEPAWWIVEFGDTAAGECSFFFTEEQARDYSGGRWPVTPLYAGAPQADARDDDAACLAVALRSMLEVFEPHTDKQDFAYAMAEDTLRALAQEG